MRVRIGIHTGEPIRTTEGYTGLDVIRGARIKEAGHGGQVLLSASTTAIVQDALLDELDRACSHFSGQASSKARCEVAIHFNMFHRPAL